MPSRATLICLGMCAAIALTATVDLLHLESRLPDGARPCDQDNPSCLNSRLSGNLARDRAADPLQDQYDSRAWVYAFGILAVAATGTAWALRRRPRTEWLGIFTDLGVIGVWVAIGAVVLLLATDASSVKPPPAQLLLVPVALLVAAAVGTLWGRSEGWADEDPGEGVRRQAISIGKFALHLGSGGQVKRSRLDRLARWLTWAAAILTAVTCIFALVFMLAQPACGGSESGSPGWTTPIESVAAVAAIGGMATGLGALILRRWVIALIALAVCPVAIILVLASTCAFY